MKTRAAFIVLVAVLCCFATSCQSTPIPVPTPEPAPIPTLSAAITLSPVIPATPEPTAEKARLNPVTLLAALIERYEGDSRYVLLSNIVPVFERFGFDASILDYYKGLQVGDYDPGVFVGENYLTVHVLPTPDGDIINYAVLRLDVENEGMALIFSRDVAAVEWAFVDWFPCAESGFTDDLGPEVAFMQAQTSYDQYGWYLRVRGRRDHGTQRRSVQTDWYDLTGRKHMLSYMSEMFALSGDNDGWLGHIVTSTDNLAYENESVTLSVMYSGILVDTSDIRDWNDIKSVAFYVEDWLVNYTPDANGVFAIDDEQTYQRMQPISLANPNFVMWKSISAKDLMTMFPDMQKTITESGTRAQKKAFEKLLASAKIE